MYGAVLKLELPHIPKKGFMSMAMNLSVLASRPTCVWMVFKLLIVFSLMSPHAAE